MSSRRLPPAWILAGGLGTRLAGVLPDRPKALAQVGERAFLDILLDQLQGAGFERVRLLLGVRHQAVLDFLVERRLRRWGLPELHIDSSIEARPLGTGGALRNARAHAGEPFFVVNGDTYTDFDPCGMLDLHHHSQAILTLAAVHENDCRRFGSLEVTAAGFLRGFREKANSSGAGWINAGVYLMNPEVLSFIADERPVSLEGEVFPRLLSDGRLIGVAKQRGAFFDIGTPESLREFGDFMRRTNPPFPAKEVSP
jgi:D-glycero-alpha-D-manno-heptose 1-phosphate guanylyltransferase